jgi:hypothetical protein
VSFDETGQVFTIPVTLEPDKEYGFSLNWPGGGSFESVDGFLLKAASARSLPCFFGCWNLFGRSHIAGAIHIHAAIAGAHLGTLASRPM